MRSKKMFKVLVLALLAGTLAPTNALAHIVGTADIEDCIVSDTITCDTKKVVTVAVSYGLPTELDATLDTGETIKLKLEKTPPVLKYPLTYLHTVNYYPYENVVKVVDPNTDYSGCIACPNSLCPTCGWQYDDSNNPIENSQGFCSYKTLGEPTCSSWRGEELLGEHSSDVNRFSTAHCLRKGELYFHGYEIGRYQKTYDINIEFKVLEDTYNAALRPANPAFNAGDTGYIGPWRLRGNLLGDFTPNRGAPELDNYILYIPAFPADHPYVQQYQNNMLLVPREELSKDGSEFDKVGIDFYKFRMMGAAASVTEAGDGLHNQLYQKHRADLDQLLTDPNLNAAYLVSAKKPFEESMEFTAGMDKLLEYKITDIDYSNVQLVMDANSIRNIETESHGIITSAQIQTFDSMSDNGLLNVFISNYGDLTTNYIVTVTDMSAKLLNAVPAKAVTLPAIESYKQLITFDIHTKENLEGPLLLYVRLKSPTGYLYDEKLVNFQTIKHGTKYPHELRMKNQNSQLSDPDESPPGDITCDNKVDYYDLQVLAVSWLEAGSFSDLEDWPYCDNIINWFDFSTLVKAWNQEPL